MAAGERLTVHTTGGGPWGFRLYGGDDEPLVVAKLRKRSKAHDAGLQEGDCLLGINSYSCRGISHATAMSLVDGTSDLTLEILRGSSAQHAVNAALQELGEKLRPVPASALPHGVSPVPRSLQRSPAPPQGQAVPASQQKATYQTQPQSQVANGFSAVANPTMFDRKEQTFQDGDKTTHVTTETSEQRVGGTTVTKYKKETVTQSYGQPASKLMFKVANVASTVPPSSRPSGTWNPSGVSVSASDNVRVQRNPDQSLTMTIDFNDSRENSQAKEQPKPIPPLFKVSKFGSAPEKPKTVGQWNPANPPQRPSPSPVPGETNGDIPLLPDEEAEYAAKLEALQKPFPVQLQRILIESGASDHDSGPESPNYLTRRRMDSFEMDSDEDDMHKKKMFADSAFYDDPEHKYPTIDEQVKMARKVAMSLLAPANKKARGHRMFMRRMVKSQKWTADEERQEKDFEWLDGEEEEKFFNPDPWSSTGHTWNPPEPQPVSAVPSKPPPPPPIPANLFQLPKLPTGPKKEEKIKALSADEFERMRLFESKTDHTQVSPAMCFSLANDLRNMKGKGGKLFAKRVARSEKWGNEGDSAEKVTKPNQDLIDKIAMQAAAAGAPLNPLAAVASTPRQPSNKSSTDGAPVNRLKDMIDPPKPKMTPWDAAVEYGNLDEAFSHLKGYSPYGRSHEGQIADNLECATKKGSRPSSAAQSTTSGPGPVSSLPTSGQPAKLPEYTRKIKPWGGSDDGASSASGASFSTPASQPSSGFMDTTPSKSFKPVGFKMPGVGTGNFQPSRTFDQSSGLSSGGAASYGGGGGAEQLAYCDL